MRAIRWKVIVLVLFLYLMFMLVLIGRTYVEQSSVAETAMDRAFYGAETSAAAEARATRWYEAAFIETGIVPKTAAMLNQQPQPKGLETFGPGVDDMVRQRVVVICTLLYQAMLRVSYAVTWSGLGGMLLLGALLDGWARRKIKQTNFGLTSPDRFGFGVVGIEITFLVGFMALLAPVPIHPYAPFVFFSILAACLLLAGSNIHKRV